MVLKHSPYTGAFTVAAPLKLLAHTTSEVEATQFFRVSRVSIKYFSDTFGNIGLLDTLNTPDKLYTSCFFVSPHLLQLFG